MCHSKVWYWVRDRCISCSSPHSGSECDTVVARSMTKVMGSSSLPSQLRTCSRPLSPSERQTHPFCKMLATSLALQLPVWSLKTHLAGSMCFSMRTTTRGMSSLVSMFAEIQIAWLSRTRDLSSFRSSRISQPFCKVSNNWKCSAWG